MALEAHLNWLKISEGQSFLIYDSSDDPNLSMMKPIMQKMAKLQKPTDQVQVYIYDLEHTNRLDLITKFELSKLFQKIEKIITEQGYSQIGAAGCDTIHNQQKGKIHIAEGSLFRVPFFAHSAIIFSIIRKLGQV